MSMLGEAKKVLEIEAQAILDLKSKLDIKFDKAVTYLLECPGKVIVTGMGKSGHIGKKIASTLTSTGTPAIFVHPAETSHGDMGVISHLDIVLALSYRGETDELKDLLSFIKRKGLKLISITGNLNSTLAKASEVALDASIKEEACPLGLAPTASTTAALALGDALAVAVLTKRGFKSEDFAQYHPGGSLGRKLLTKVKDLMHEASKIPMVKAETSVKEVISKMTSSEVRGVCGVTDSGGALIGIITDGDLRRRLEKSMNPLEDKVKDIMGKTPKTISGEELAEKALFMMEQFAIQSLFVIDADKKPLGLIHFQDLLRARIR
ncbi:MAG: KpsF/GutQ family sugar-phosphate isomerase [Oligoflexia bacterium]|nr:KpsF/GutQ family sugar-phosphate isomerase [Oligoflexia bacterium]